MAVASRWSPVPTEIDAGNTVFISGTRRKNSVVGVGCGGGLGYSPTIVAQSSSPSLKFNLVTLQVRGYLNHWVPSKLRVALLPLGAITAVKLVTAPGTAGNTEAST